VPTLLENETEGNLSGDKILSNGRQHKQRRCIMGLSQEQIKPLNKDYNETTIKHETKGIL
jgi:hypothetical protein